MVRRRRETGTLADQCVGVRLMALAGLLALPLFSGCGEKRVVYDDGKVRVEAFAPPVIFVHASDNVVLSVGGRKFSRVSGSDPYFLKIPNRDALLFVTDVYADDRAIHIFDRVQNRDLVIHFNNELYFGGNIKAGNGPDVPFSDYIATADEHVIVIVGQTDEFKHTARINLDTRRMEEIKRFHRSPTREWIEDK